MISSLILWGGGEREIRPQAVSHYLPQQGTQGEECQDLILPSWKPAAPLSIKVFTQITRNKKTDNDIGLCLPADEGKELPQQTWLRHSGFDAQKAEQIPVN